MEIFDNDDFILEFNEQELNLFDEFGHESDDDSAAVLDYCHSFENQAMEEHEYIEEKILKNQEFLFDGTNSHEAPVSSRLAIDSTMGPTGSVVVKINKKRVALPEPPTLSSKSARAASPGPDVAIVSSASVTALARKGPESAELSSSSSSTEAEKRLRFLMTVPGLMIQHMNSMNEEALKSLLSDACDPFCVLITPAAGGREVSGAVNIATILSSYASVMPDYVSTVRRSSISHRVISSVLTVSCTHLVNMPSMAMINYLQTGAEADPSFIEARDAGLQMMRAGKSVRMHTRSVLHMVLNKARSHIERIINIKKKVSVCEAPPVDDI